jgi:ADP-ribosyl-[dinitrogen reductase] hydrolase
MQKTTITPLERYRGSLLGLAVGDALGAPVEFKKPGDFIPVTEMRCGGDFNLKPGEWTDDTSLALCLAESLISCRGFDPKDQLTRYCDWYRHGHLSSTGKCFDIGNTTRLALQDFERSGNPCPGLCDERSKGNGSLMRLAPVPLAFARTPSRALELSGESSRTTHAHPVCVDACRYLGALILGAALGCPKEKILDPLFSPIEGYWNLHPLSDDIAIIASGSFREKEPPEINGSGYVVTSLEAALWAFARTDSFREGCLAVVNLGDDADTTGAIYGQLAGAYYGFQAIPEEWKKTIVKRELIEQFSNDLYSLTGDLGNR